MQYTRLLAFSAALAASVASTSASGFPACGFIIPDEVGLRQENGNECSILIENKENYGSLDYIHIYNQASLTETLSDETYFTSTENGQYFVSEEINDPRLTLNTLKQSPAKKIELGDINGYEGHAIYFLQTLPPEHQGNNSYSMQISCTLIAIGNKDKSLKARVCAPTKENESSSLKKITSTIYRIKPIQ